MLAYRIEDMTCGHCASAIAKALKSADRDARVAVDLAQRLVTVEPAEADAQELAEAITEAGYTPVPVEPAPAAAAPGKSGGCCGCCR